jgi:hypothetical protein
MYRNQRTGEDMYSIAEAALILGISPSEALALIKGRKLGHSANLYGVEISHTDIAHYLAYERNSYQKKRIRRRRK